VLAVDGVADLHFGSSIDAYQQVALYRYDASGNRAHNITDWALTQFRRHYQPGAGRKVRPITKEAIFQYIYGVLHDPNYRRDYAKDLEREFPRVPLRGSDIAMFWRWAGWGARLIELHVGYQSAPSYPLHRLDVMDTKARTASLAPKPLLRSNAESHKIVIDSETTLEDVPAEAWRYRLGTRCGIDWVLEQYKESKPRDKYIAQHFDTYRFADHKEQVIDLISRVISVSVETMQIVDAMNSIK
jgi:predicted helicase